jgi:membrane protein YqaA with SNARE-associated domain
MREPNPAVRQKLLAQVTQGYAAIVDAPGCFFIADWVEMYPDAKFVLGQRRSAKIWLDSFNGSVGKVFGRGAMYWLGYFVPELRMAFALNNLWDEQTRERYGVGVHTEEYYRLHFEWVRSVVPKERVLEFQASDGWAPLAGFLGREKPEGDFPRMNDSKSTNGIIMSFLIYGVGVWVGVLVVVVLIVRGLMWYMRA